MKHSRFVRDSPKFEHLLLSPDVAVECHWPYRRRAVRLFDGHQLVGGGLRRLQCARDRVTVGVGALRVLSMQVVIVVVDVARAQRRCLKFLIA